MKKEDFINNYFWIVKLPSILKKIEKIIWNMLQCDFII